MNPPATKRISLKALPQGTLLRSVTAATGTVDGRTGTRVRLTDDIARHGVPGVDYVDQPTMVLLPIPMRTGSISVDIHSRLTDDAPDYARGFAGIAFHVTPSFDHFEAVYLRPTNGTLTNPGKPREGRGIQYFAYPDWPFDRLRSERPDAGYESAARIAPGNWARLALDVEEDQVSAFVDGIEVLRIAPLMPPSRGGIGLFVDIGTDAHFANLAVTRCERQ